MKISKAICAFILSILLTISSANMTLAAIGIDQVNAADGQVMLMVVDEDNGDSTAGNADDLYRITSMPSDSEAASQSTSAIVFYLLAGCVAVALSGIAVTAKRRSTVRS